VLQGGRYDDLLGRFGHQSPAVGFAIDVEAAAAVLEAAAQAHPGTPGAPGGGGPARVLVTGEPAAAAARAVELRARGQVAAPLLIPMSRSDAEAYGTRWGYGEVIEVAAPRAGGAAGAGQPRRKVSARKG